MPFANANQHFEVKSDARVQDPGTAVGPVEVRDATFKPRLIRVLWCENPL